jgi:hypothetical protein
MAPALVTLTYAGIYTQYAQPSNYRATLRDLSAFLRKLRHIQPGILYIWVPELQLKNNRNTVHYHILCFNLKYLTNVEMLEVKNAWPKGFDSKSTQGGENIKRLNCSAKDERKAMFYIAKYLTKAGEWVPPELNLYGLSRGLVPEEKIDNPYHVEKLLASASALGHVCFLSNKSTYDKWRLVSVTKAKIEPLPYQVRQSRLVDGLPKPFTSSPVSEKI